MIASAGGAARRRPWVFLACPFSASVLVLAVSTSGCSPILLSPLQRQRLEAAQAFANRTTAAYHVALVRVRPSVGLRTIYHAEDRSISLDTRELDGPAWPVSLAHELGHVTLAPRGDEIRNRRDLHRIELEANARAIEILVRVLGWPERDAVRRFAAYLVDANDKIRSGARRLARGHLAPCDELDDLLNRFPGTRDVPTCRRE